MRGITSPQTLFEMQKCETGSSAAIAKRIESLRSSPVTSPKSAARMIKKRPSEEQFTAIESLMKVLGGTRNPYLYESKMLLADTETRS